MQIISGKQSRAIKTLIYGPEGIGKSTFAAQFPRPLFIDTEGSTVHMDVRRLPKPEAWLELIEEVNWVLANPGECGTLVIDTADWAETLCNEYVCARDKKAGIEDYGYGKGYVYAQEEFGRLPNLLEQLIDKGVNVVICCHAQMRKFEQPDEMGAYDRWEMKLSKKVGPMLREWCDMVLFANYKTIVVNVDGQGAQKGKNKVQGGSRVMYTTHHPCWDAKNRFALPDELPFKYDYVRQIIEGTGEAIPTAPENPSALARKVEADVKPKAKAPAPKPVPAPEPQAAPQAADDVPPEYAGLPGSLARLMREAEVQPDEVRYVIAQKGIYPADTPWSVITANKQFMDGWLMHPGVWPQVVNAVRQNREKAPF